MFNIVIIEGRVANELILEHTESGKCRLRFSVAVHKRSKKHNNASFIDCVAWDEKAEFIAAHWIKGKPIGIQGWLNADSYDDRNGIRRKSVEVRVVEVHFIGPKKEEEFERVDDLEPLPFE